MNNLTFCFEAASQGQSSARMPQKAIKNATKSMVAKSYGRLAEEARKPGEYVPAGTVQGRLQSDEVNRVSSIHLIILC